MIAYMNKNSSLRIALGEYSFDTKGPLFERDRPTNPQTQEPKNTQRTMDTRSSSANHLKSKQKLGHKH